jgi:GNAT superfamily N-acetyltransferase
VQALLEDPTSPVIYRRSGVQPFPEGHTPTPSGITIKHVILRDGITKATLIPYSSVDQVPVSLLTYLCDTMNSEIEGGDSYPMIDPMAHDFFGPYWVANFAAVMLLGEYNSQEEVKAADAQGIDWKTECLGTFYIKPNYPGRSSHVCNAGFLVTQAARNRGVGRLMGETYIQWAPRLVGILVEQFFQLLSKLTNNRATYTRSSILSMRPMSRHVASGMLLGFNALVASKDVVT